MPLNFGLLQPIQQQAQPMIGQGTTSNTTASNPTSLADETKGFLSAYQSGQQIQQNDQALKQGDQKLEMGDMALKEARDKMKLSDTLRAVADKGDGAIINAYKAAGQPEMAVDYQIKLDQARQNKANAGILEAGEHKAVIETTGNFYQNVATATDPKTGQLDPQKASLIWDMQHKQLPDSIKKFVPEHFDPNSFYVGMSNNKREMADYLDKHPNDTKNSLQKAQIGRTEAEQKLQQAQASGDPAAIADAQRTVDESNKYVNKEANPTKMVNSPLDQNLGEQDAKIAKDASDTRASMTQFKATASEAQKALEKTPALALGPVASVLNVQNASPEVQVLRSSLNALALQAKELYKLGSGQGFTDADRDFLTMIVGNPGQYKGSVKTILNKMQELSDRVTKQNWNRENGIRKSSTNYDQWLEANPDPSKPHKAGAAQPSSTSAPQEHSAEDIAAEMKRRGLT